MIMSGLADAASLTREGRLVITGEQNILDDLTGLLDQFVRRFPLVTPRS